MNNQKVIITLIVILLLLLGGGLFFFRTSSPADDKVPVLPTPIVVLPTISDDINVSLTAKQNNTIVVLTIEDIPRRYLSVEYELIYTTGAGLPRGVLGKINLNGESQLTRDITLGTCSNGKCLYDQGVEEIDLSLKFNTEEGSSIFQKRYSL